MTDDERAVREWLNGAINTIKNGGLYIYSRDDDARHRATALRLLDRPTIPRGADVPDDVVKNMIDVAYDGDVAVDSMRAAIDVLYNWRTAPPPVKKIERWEVIHPGYKSGMIFHSEAEALDSLPSGGRIIKLVEAADADK